jgi:hypothetical protein
MKNLILYFAPYYLRLWGMIFVSVMAILWAGPRFGLKAEELSFTFAFIWLGGLIGAIFLQRNISWVKSLPISKSRILLSSVMLILLNLLLTAGTAGIYYIFLSKQFPKEIDPSFFSPLIGLHFGGVSLITLFMLAGVLGITSYSNFSTSAASRIPQRGLQQTVKIGVGLLSGFLPLRVLNSNFLFQLAMGIALWVGTGLSICASLALYPKHKRRVLQGVALLVFVVGGASYSLLRGEVESTNPRIALDVDSFLGSLSAGIPEERLAALLEEIKNPKAMKQAFRGDSNLIERIQLEAWLKTRSNPILLKALTDLLRPDSINPDSIKDILAHFRTLNLEPDAESLYAFTIYPFERKTALELLQSKGLFDYGLGVILCRRFTERECIPFITKWIKVSPESSEIEKFLVSISKTTLSILYAKWLSNDDFDDLKRGRRTVGSEKLVTPDCSEFTKKESSGIIYLQDAGPLNYCSRKIAFERDPSHPRKEMGWISGDTSKFRDLFLTDKSSSK